jgi:hypothetical protein
MPQVLEPGIVTSFEIRGADLSGIQCKWMKVGIARAPAEEYCDMKVSITEAGKVDYAANGFCRHNINMQTRDQLIWSVDFIGSSPIICGSHCDADSDCNNANCPLCNSLSKACSST